MHFFPFASARREPAIHSANARAARDDNAGGTVNAPAAVRPADRLVISEAPQVAAWVVDRSAAGVPAIGVAGDFERYV